MKIIEKLSEGVFSYHNGMIGTKDLPVMMASLSKRTKKTNKKVQHLLNNIKTPTPKSKPTWRQMLAALRPALITA